MKYNALLDKFYFIDKGMLIKLQCFSSVHNKKYKKYLLIWKRTCLIMIKCVLEKIDTVNENLLEFNSFMSAYIKSCIFTFKIFTLFLIPRLWKFDYLWYKEKIEGKSESSIMIFLFPLFVVIYSHRRPSYDALHLTMFYEHK